MSINKILMMKGHHSSKKYLQVGKDVFVQNRVDSKKSNRFDAYDGECALEFIKIKKEAYDKRILDLATKLKDSIDGLELMKQTLYDQPLEVIELVEKELEKKEPIIKPRKGCVQLQVGKIRLTMRD